jgi:uncharacterized protein YndB with AHSA1/START domain
MTFDAGPLAPVHAESDGDRWILVFTKDLRHPPAKVWAALTDPDRVGQWAPFECDRDLGTTGPATLTMIDGDTRTPLQTTVTRAEPPSLLEYGFGPDRLCWELTPTDEGTRLTLRDTVADRDWLPKVAAGWHLCLLVAQHLLDHHPIPVIRGRAAAEYGFEQLQDQYVHQLHIPSTTTQPT